MWQTSWLLLLFAVLGTVPAPVPPAVTTSTSPDPCAAPLPPDDAGAAAVAAACAAAAAAAKSAAETWASVAKLQHLLDTITNNSQQAARSPSVPNTTVGELVAAHSGLSSWLPGTLLQDEQVGVISATLPKGKMTVARASKPPRDLTVQVAGTAASAMVPASVLAGLPEPTIPGDDVAVVVSSLDTSDLEEKGQDEYGALVAAMVGIDLTWVAASEVISVRKAPEPILFWPGIDYVEGMSCAFWNETEERWSQEGVEIHEGVPGRPLVCRTEHLSFFAALVQGFVDRTQCSSFRLLTAESLGQMLEVSWIYSTGTICFVSILFILFLAILAGARRDRMRGKQGWSDVFLLKAIYAGPAIEGEVRQDHEIEEEGGLDFNCSSEGYPSTGTSGPLSPHASMMSPVSNFTSRGASFAKESSAARDALDDIIAHWLDYFSEARSLLEGILGSISFQSLCCKTGSCAIHSQEAMVYAMLTSAQRLAGCSVGVSEATVALVLEEKTVHDHFVSDWIARHPALRVGERVPATPVLGRQFAEKNWTINLAWQSTTPRTSGSGSSAENLSQQSWAKLYDQVFNQVHRHINEHHTCWNMPAAFCRLYLARNPFGAMWSFDPLISCKLRAFFTMVEMAGALLLTSVFFQASSSLRNRRTAEACGPRDVADTLGYNVGRLLVIGLGSLFIAEIPVVFLHSLTTRCFKQFEYEGCPAWKQQLRAWEMQDRAIYVLGSLYILVAVFFVAVFLANISDEDHFDFMLGCVLAAFQDYVVVPTATSLLLPAISATLFKLNNRLGGVEKAELLKAVSSQLVKKTPAIEI